MDEGKKSRKKKRALTIEDLFTSVSTVKAYNDFPAPPRYVLSPRSAEACLREGIDPEQLRIRDLDSFWEPGIDASRQGMRHEVYSERRHSIMKSLRKARTAIINADVLDAWFSPAPRLQKVIQSHFHKFCVFALLVDSDLCIEY